MQAGDYVAIEFSSADTSVASLVTLKDANSVTRVLASNERLLISSFNIDVSSAAGLVTFFNDKNSNGTVEAGERIAEFQDCDARFSGGPEGYACPIGITPKVIAVTAGQVSLNGEGRIVIGQSQGLRPNWQSSQISKGA